MVCLNPESIVTVRYIFSNRKLLQENCHKAQGHLIGSVACLLQGPSPVGIQNIKAPPKLRLVTILHTHDNCAHYTPSLLYWMNLLLVFSKSVFICSFENTQLTLKFFHLNYPILSSTLPHFRLFSMQQLLCKDWRRKNSWSSISVSLFNSITLGKLSKLKSGEIWEMVHKVPRIW